MWFASKKGLYRYDGYTFITYKNDPLKLNSLASNSLESLCIDSAGILWIGSFDDGLDRFDPITEQFTHFNHEANNDASLINDTVSSLLYDSRGVLWIGTPRGLDRFDP
jgi:streptogramin lyase